MGCNIHLYTEVKVNGHWFTYGHPNVPRNYTLFALMADVRNSDGEFKPVAKPKGLPADCAAVTQAANDHFQDGHSHSWLSAEELVQLEEAWAKVKPAGWNGSDLEHHFFGYLERNSWAGFYKYPNSRPKWVEDVRFVFWFD